MSQPSPADANPDSIEHGFGSGCATIVVGGLACLVLGVGLSLLFVRVFAIPAAGQPIFRLTFVGTLLLPVLANFALVLRYRRQGRARAASGALRGLLVAAPLAFLLLTLCGGLVW
jgi:hypothetical protein